MENAKINGTFRILSAIGIILIVAGHVNLQIFDLGGLFPYYSFHVALFLFISGYFYKDSEEEHIGSYIKRKAIRLLLPYFVWNIFYGIFAAVLRSGDFIIGGNINFRTLFLDPFLDGHQFGYNFAAWFVPALFIVEIINVCMRRVLSFLKLKNEYFILLGCLLVGIAVVWMAIGGHVWGYYKFPGRILFMLPIFQMGQFYKKKLEKIDHLSNIAYFSVLLAVQLCIVLGSAGLAYSMVWCSGFANGPIIPYLTIITGTAFWLRIAKILEPLLSKLRLVEWIGSNTYEVMMHHILGFMMVKGIFYAISRLTLWCADFEEMAFFTDVNYIYLLNGAEVTKWIYMAAGIGVPFLMWKLAGCIKQVGKSKYAKKLCIKDDGR